MNTNFENYKETNETETNFDSKQEGKKLNIFNKLFGMMPQWMILVIAFAPVATILLHPSSFFGFLLTLPIIMFFKPVKSSENRFKNFLSKSSRYFIYLWILFNYLDIWGVVIFLIGIVISEVKRFAPLKKYINFRIFMLGFSIVALIYAFIGRPFKETVLEYDWFTADNHFVAIFLWSIVVYFVLFAIDYTTRKAITKIYNFFTGKNKSVTQKSTNADSVSNTNQNEFTEANSQAVDDEEVTIIEKAPKKTSERIDPSEASYDSGDYVNVNKSDYDGVFTPIKKWARKD